MVNTIIIDNIGFIKTYDVELGNFPNGKHLISLNDSFDSLCLNVENEDCRILLNDLIQYHAEILIQEDHNVILFHEFSRKEFIPNSENEKLGKIQFIHYNDGTNILVYGNSHDKLYLNSPLSDVFVKEFDRLFAN